jgi:hypothetical protein
MVIKKRTLKNFIKLLRWLIPPVVFEAITFYKFSAVFFSLKNYRLIQANKKIHNRHKGQRCFILCNGPSVKNQNIKHLRGEIVFSVSNGYLHPDFDYIKPRYHCIPQVTFIDDYSSKSKTNSTSHNFIMPYNEKLVPQKTYNTYPEVVSWLNKIDTSIGNAEIFLSYQQFNLVKDNNLFKDRKCHFLCMGKNKFPFLNNIPDLSCISPSVQSVPIMSLMIAMYMGFKEIYLLGTDHDWFVKKEYSYFYGKGVTKLDLECVNNDKDLDLLLDEIPVIEKLFQQYRSVNKIAKANNIKIFNATNGGMLDEFKRINFEKLFL